jgi:molybdenum cofactor cytidylyltransferase
VIDGIVLAAGASKRMGEPKPLLQVDGMTFLERAVHVLRAGGCRYVLAVVNDDDWIERLADVSGAAVLINDAPDSEQIDSLQLGIANLSEDCDGVLVLPVDFPNVQKETVAKLIQTFEERNATIVNPSCDGEPGHPVIFSRRVFAELLGPDLPDGARSVIAAHMRDTFLVPVDDRGVLIDVDTPEDYQKHVNNEATGERASVLERGNEGTSER